MLFHSVTEEDIECLNCLAKSCPYCVQNSLLELLELVVRLAHKYDLSEKNVRCRFIHSCVLQLLQLLLFATTIYLSKMIDPSKKHAD